MLDSSEYLRGRWGEVVWNAVVLHTARWGVIATGDYSGVHGGQAPMMHGMNEVVLPDFDTAKRGVRAFLECKLKDDWFEWRKSGKQQTGINVSSLRHYRQVEAETGSSVILGMLNESTGEMRANTLDALGEERVSENSGWPIANWDVHRFRLICHVNVRNLNRLLYDNGQIRQRRERTDAAYLAKIADFLKPTQGELDLLHYDILARGRR